MRKEFLSISAILLGIVGVAGFIWSPIWFLYTLLLPLFFLGLSDILQNKKAVLKNFPVLGHFRYLFEFIRPEIQQYFVENDTDGTPINRELRSVVYQRAKSQLDTVPFGTQANVYRQGYEWMNHSLVPISIDASSLRVSIGNALCRNPYSASLFNISGMSYGSISKNAVLALNGGAKDGHFYHNTGEGGISPYHKMGGRFGMANWHRLFWLPHSRG